jgi:hypothetical protein
VIVGNDPCLEFLAQHKDTKWICSVCTGALVLGAAGLLEGYTCTTHWAYKDVLRLFPGSSNVFVAAAQAVDLQPGDRGGVFVVCFPGDGLVDERVVFVFAAGHRHIGRFAISSGFRIAAPFVWFSSSSVTKRTVVPIRRNAPLKPPGPNE